MKLRLCLFLAAFPGVLQLQAQSGAHGAWSSKDFNRPRQPGPPKAQPPKAAALNITNAVMSMTVTSSFPLPQFESWPSPPPRPTPLPGTAPQPSAPERASVGLPMPEAAQDKTLYSFRAENLDLKTALALFARANKLNIVPDQDVVGQVTVDVQDLPLDRMMQALLEAHDFTWSEKGGLIRVRAIETRSFILDYLRLTREGHGSSAVTLSSASTSGGGASGGGGGLGGGAAVVGGSGAGGVGNSGSQMNLKLENPVEFWKELDEQLRRLLSPAGKESLAINSIAGIIQVTDRPSALKRVQQFLEQLTHCVARQVDIEAKLYDVTLGDQFQFGIDWQRIAFVQGGQFRSLGSPFGDPSNLDLTRTPFLTPGGGFNIKEPAITLLFSNKNTTAILQALKEQGEVTVISQPRLRVLNNQTAIMKVGTDQPFFTRQSQVIASGGGQTSLSGDLVSIITVGTVLALTPQISEDDWITLDITPAITSFVETKVSPSRESSAPVLDIKQSSTIVRLRDRETIVMGGLIQNTTSKSTRKIPILGDIPLLGKLFQGTFDAKQKKELVIFLTPTIVR